MRMSVKKLNHISGDILKTGLITTSQKEATSKIQNLKHKNCVNFQCCSILFKF